MSQFYSRYIPSVNSTQAPVQQDEQLPTSRKRKLRNGTNQDQEPEPKQIKKQKHTGGEENVQELSDAQDWSLRSKHESHEDRVKDGNQILDKYRSTTVAEGNNIVDIRYRRTAGSAAQAVNDETNPSGLRDKSKRSRVEDESTEDGEQEAQYQKRHAGVFSKFGKLKKTDGKTDSASVRSKPAETEDVHELGPIPQPTDPIAEFEKPVYSTMTKWQSNAVKVVHGTRPDFATLGLSESLVHNLSAKDMKQAFPIQSTVIPLLLRGSQKYNGDICVSAATGSGKTLAYVVPIIEALRNVKNTKLRAVVVVPTRELVQQVRQMCDICAAGTSLIVASASGNKSLESERASLVEETDVYNPEEFKREQEQPVDWSNFSLQKLLNEAPNLEPLESINFVKHYSSRVDILITTPGRFVDHLTSTPGFNLDHVEWLVVDEADRLLNESYQEWVETVVPALTSRTATIAQDRVLSYMRMDLPPRIVTKVLLSATMTSDITKLNSLGLQNPKLVVLGGGSASVGHNSLKDQQSGTDEPLDNGTGLLYLPATLSETAVAVKDGSDKPLFLLKLLRDMLPAITAKHGNPNGKASSRPDVDKSSSTSSSSDDNSTDTSSVTASSSTDSGSESTLDSSSDSESDSDSSASSSSTSPRPKDTALRMKHANGVDRRIADGSANKQPRALVFTRSTASAMRLSRLLSILSPELGSRISTLTRSTAASASSRRAFSAFRAYKTCVLIATDRASRGLDLPDLEFVVNYDVPSSALTYIHRVGRTARAGKEGSAWTLVEHKEGAWFWREIGGKEASQAHAKTPEESIHRSTKIKRVQMTVEDEGLKAVYEDALKQLGNEVKG